jgi:tetratricopeptide (TPR) repeat protein
MKRDESKKNLVRNFESITMRGSLRDTLDMVLEMIKEGSLETGLYYNAANMAFHLGDLVKARQLVNRLLELDPGHTNGWMLFGDIKDREKNIIDSNNYARVEDQLLPDSILINGGSPSLIVRVAKKGDDTVCDEQNKNLDFDTITYADICARQGYYNKALKIYQDHLRENPENEELRKKIENIRKRLGND